MWKLLITTWVVSWLAQTACAEPILQIVGETWPADSETTCSVTLRVNSQGTEDVPLSLWQVVCQIVPSTDSPSSAFFTDLPESDYTPASHFVFQNESSGVFRSDESPLGTLFGAISLSAGGETLQPSDTNLLHFSLTSPDAVGTFDIVLVPYTATDTGSFWSDANGTSRPFEVAPPPGRSPGVVATVVFSAPEPSSGLTLLSGVGALILMGVGQRMLFLRSMSGFVARGE
jgi:hypothetical protein